MLIKARAAFSLAVLCLAAASPGAPAPKKIMLMNRLAPSKMVLYIASADGSGERSLLPTSGFDYNASFSPDGKWIVFTSERNGLGQADLYRVHQDGSALERLTNDPALDDQAAFSPRRRADCVRFDSRGASHRQHLDSRFEDAQDP